MPNSPVARGRQAPALTTTRHAWAGWLACGGILYASSVGWLAGCTWSPDETRDRLEVTSVVQEAETISAGGGHACALTAAGDAWCWGNAWEGALGDGVVPGDDDEGSRATPVAVVGGHRFTSITAGSGHTCALDTEARAWCWGNGDAGRLGDGSTQSGQADDGEVTAELVATPTAVVGGHAFAAISAGADHTCALDKQGAAWCWGANDVGQLGAGDAAPSWASTPVPVVGGHVFAAITTSSLSDEQSHSCALDRAGTAWCWGADGFGQLGDAIPGAQSSSRSSDDQPPVPTRNAPGRVSGSHTYISISAGNHYTCALDIQGVAWCWGADDLAQLGDGADAGPDKASPVLVDTQVPFTLVSAGESHTCAIDATRKAWCWGSAGPFGTTLGDNGKTPWVGFSPVAVAGAHKYLSASAGGAFTCAVDTEGTPWCWGDNQSGSLGNGHVDTDTATRMPSPVAGLTTRLAHLSGAPGAVPSADLPPAH